MSELRAVHPELYDDDADVLAWNVERHVWKKSPRLEDGRRVNLWDVKVGKTLESWRAEPRPEPGQLEEMKCERHISHWKPYAVKLRRSNVVYGEMVGGIRDASRIEVPHEDGCWTWQEDFGEPMVAPCPVAYGEPSDETAKEFWQRWNSTLTPTEKKELRPLSDFVMMKSRRPLTDDLPSVPDRRTKVTKRKDSKAMIEATRSAIGDVHMASAVAECLASGAPYATAKIVAEREGLSYLALKQHIARARRAARKQGVTFLRDSVAECREHAA